jgi:DNA ligase-associated metallophosphoesterase
MLPLEISGEKLWLHPLRAAYWEREGLLLLADLHLGKARHFRQAGLAAPPGISHANWDRLLSLLFELQPQRVLFLGDLFHSHYNSEWDEFCTLSAQFAATDFELTPGNHDLLGPDAYQRARIVVHPPTLRVEPFVFSHHPLELVPDGFYNIAGHGHPCAYLSGAGRQRLKLPCFYFGARQGLLPAFGQFTGMHTVRLRDGDRVVLIANDQLIAV